MASDVRPGGTRAWDGQTSPRQGARRNSWLWRFSIWEVPWGTPKSSKLAVVNGKTNGLGPLGYPYFRKTPSVQSLQVAVFFCCVVGTWWTSTVWRHAFRGNFVPRPRSWLTLSLWQCGGFKWWSNYKKTIRVHQLKTRVPVLNTMNMLNEHDELRWIEYNWPMITGQIPTIWNDQWWTIVKSPSWINDCWLNMVKHG